MADQASAIVVETWAFYEPVMRIGLKETTPIYNVIVTRPRFTDQLRYERPGATVQDRHMMTTSRTTTAESLAHSQKTESRFERLEAIQPFC